MSKRRVKPGEWDTTGVVLSDGTLVTPLRRWAPGDRGVVVRVVCTDRGQHGAADLGTARVWPDRPGRFDFDGGTDHQLRSATDGPSWRHRRLPCPCCPRRPKVSHDTLWRALAGTAAAGHRRLDISGLPF